MADPRIIDDDKDLITATVSDEVVRSWIYADENDRRLKIRLAHEFAEGWFQCRKAADAVLLALSDDPWDDRPDDLTAAIRAAHPAMSSKDYQTYHRAIELVNNRHSKYALVDLINYLLSENNRLDGIVDSLVEKS